MTCRNCGKELTFVRKPAKDEIENFIFINNKLNSVSDALNPDVVSSYKFETDEQVYAYFKAVFDLKAEANFLYYNFRKLIAEKLSEDLEKEISPDDFYFDEYGIYIH